MAQGIDQLPASEALDRLREAHDLLKRIMNAYGTPLSFETIREQMYALDGFSEYDARLAVASVGLRINSDFLFELP